MALADSTFDTNIKAAFNKDQWDDCANSLASAIKSYIESGKVNTTVTATVTHPFPPGGSHVQTLHGINGTITAPASSSLANNIKIAFQSTAWASCASSLASYVNTYFKQCTVSISSYSDATGHGSSTSIASDPGLAALITGITSTFNLNSWDIAVTTLRTHIKTFITQTNIVKTTDSGSSPPQSWKGPGQGTIS
ncbi:MAG TPA: hypothetical protein P5136_02280 [Methanofastidiosum sp.]|nr:hypothetical protein [Methanofastidiosum sp.]